MPWSRCLAAVLAATLSLVWVAGAVGAGGATDRPTVALGGGSLLGTVTAEADGAPIAGACIALEANGGRYRTTSDDRGRWTLTDLPAGPAFLAVNACPDAVSGYAATWWPAATSPDGSHAIVVERGRVHDGIDVALVLAATVTGRVLDVGARPVAGACVAARDGHGNLLGGVRTDADGRYVLAALPAGEHVVEARDCVAPATRTPDATSVVVQRGDRRSLPHLQLGRGGSISGAIISEHTNRPTNGVCVTLWTGDTSVGGSLYRGVRTSGMDVLGAPLAEPGRFVFDGLEPGRYRVFAGFDFCSEEDGFAEFWFGGPRGPAMYAPDATTAILDVAIDGQVRDVDVRVQAVPTITKLCPWPVPSGAADVSDDQPHREGIDCLATYGVATSRADGTFAPAVTITRGQLASLLVRTIAVVDSSVLLPDPPRAFADTYGSVHEESINQLAALGVFRGTSAGEAAAGQLVTRGQLAALLVRAYEVVGQLPLQIDGDRWTDDDGHLHEPALNRAAAAGLLAGTGTTTVQPDRPVTRGQAATALARFADRLLRDA